MDIELLERLRQFLDYNPETGEFHWKVAAGKRAKVGSLAGTLRSDGRLRIGFEGKMYLAHRLAWLMTHGNWPSEMVDHLDGDPFNNRINNLRDVSRSVNLQNQRKAQSDNKSSGLLGVSFNKLKGKFVARIQISGRQKHLGYFSTPEEAHTAYLAVKRKLHEGCTV